MSAVASLFALDLVAKGLLALTGILLIRTMPSEDYASYTFAVAVAALATEALVGTWRSLYVATTRRFDTAGGGAFLSVQLLIVLATIVATVAFSGILNGLYWIVAFIVVGRALLELARGTLQRAMKFAKFASVELARAMLLFVSVVGATVASGGVIRAPQALFLEAIGLVGLGSFLLLRQRSMFKGFGIHESAGLLRALVSGEYRFLCAYLIVLALFTQLDVFMLRIFGSELSLATYGSTLRYYAVMSMALAAVHAVFLPLAQRVEDADDLHRLLALHKRMVVAFGAVALASIAAAGWLIPLIDQGQYPEAIPTFRILAASSVISFTFSPYVHLLIRFEDFRYMVRLLAIGVLAEVGLNLALVPPFGAVGAAVGTTIASGLITISMFVRSKRFRQSLAKTQGLC